MQILKKIMFFPILTTYIDQNQILVGTIRCRIARGIVWWHFRRNFLSESKVILKKLNFPSIYSGVYRKLAGKLGFSGFTRERTRKSKIEGKSYLGN